MTRLERIIKRAFDFGLASVALAALSPVIGAAAICARYSTGSSGIFRQARIGQNGRIFFIYKIRTMRDVQGMTTTITTDKDVRITRLGRLLRRWKIDELPQLVNVARGEMSLVGPRPDVPEYLERIRLEAPLVLTVRPGLTGPASLKYRREEQILARQSDPQNYNDQVIFPDKLRINEAYVKNFHLLSDLRYLWQTVMPFGSGTNNEHKQVALENAAEAA